ncbi:HOS1 [Candida pseudojiufengensis]|uniref:HOS1 n=1 Tax=Candida pseudojiufengensis TaxID=497109 RepID=UPI002224B593|nr:HOS1 [Candida pseudojiufengensis]KAI5965817.1 HOS1 [Candida pseudojiufengensis]
MKHIFITNSNLLTRITDELPSNETRQSLVQGLIQAYGLLEYCEVIDVEPIEYKELTLYHDSNFIRQLCIPRIETDQKSSEFDNLKNELNKLFDDVEDIEYEETRVDNDDLFGLSHDCYPFPFMRYYINLTAASTIQLFTKVREYVKCQQDQQVKKRVIGLNWYGGRHHCHKSKASGFCYINDIVLGISIIRRLTSKSRVFYLDLDLHNGDGVAEAFKFSSKVITCSIHRYDVGFYPNSGGLEESRFGMYNIPTDRGLTDENVMWILQNIVINLINKHEPNYLVIQTGCDGLSTDPHKEWNLTMSGFDSALQYLISNISIDIPIMILGGGGYNDTETAKCWTYLTKSLIGSPIPKRLVDEANEIPEHTMIDHYEKDGYRFWTDLNSSPSKMQNQNDLIKLQQIKDYILSIT